MVVVKIHYKDGVGSSYNFDKYVAPDRSHFNYWTFWGNGICRFINSDVIDCIAIEEVIEDGD